MHIADALGTPLVAVFGPTDPELTGPYIQRDRVIRAAGACERSPCLERRCPKGTRACMELIEPAEVAERAVAVLEGRG